MKRVLDKNVIVLWISLGALICAALALNTTLNLLESKGQE